MKAHGPPRLLGAALAMTLVALPWACAPAGDDDRPTPPPMPEAGALRGYVDPPPVGSYPADEDRINGWIAADQFDSMRAHGWDLWASINTRVAGDLPVWETWYSGYELFRWDPTDTISAPGDPAPGFPDDTLRHAAHRDFEGPHQFASAHRGGVAPAAGRIPDARHERVTAFNRFTRSTAHHIWRHRLNDADVLQDTLDWMLANDVPIADRQVLVSPDSTDAASIVLKVVWQFISGDSASLVPYYAGDSAAVTTDTLMPMVRTWRQAVWVDPTGALQPGMEREGSLHGGPPQPYPVASLDDFYFLVLDSADAAAFSHYASLSGDDVGASDFTDPDSLMAMVQPGNVALLAAIHLTTKEIPNWTWHTYWWAHDPADPEFGADRPASIPAPWNHYNQRTAYSMVLPAGGPDGAPNVQWNPYLESNLTGTYAMRDAPDDTLTWYGPQTNCMSCHRMASFGGDGSLTGPGYRPAMFISPGDSLFAEALKTDFLWSVAGRAGSPPVGR